MFLTHNMPCDDEVCRTLSIRLCICCRVSTSSLSFPHCQSSSLQYSLYTFVHLLQTPKLTAQVPIPLMMLDDAAQCVHIRSSAANPKAYRPGSHTFDDAGCRTTCMPSSRWKLSLSTLACVRAPLTPSSSCSRRLLTAGTSHCCLAMMMVVTPKVGYR